MKPRIGYQGLGASVVLLAVALLVLSLYVISPGAAREPDQPRVLALPTESVQYQSVRIPVHSRGKVQSARRIPLATDVGGQVVSVADTFRDGGFVEAGTTLIELEKEPFELDIARQRNQVRAAKLHLAETRANAEVARENNARSSGFARFEPQMAEAKSRVEAARAGLRSAQRRLEKATIEAPFTGRLDQVAVQSGQYVQAGMELARLYSTGELEVRLPVRDDWLELLGFPLKPDAPLPSMDVRLEGRFAGRQGRWQGEVLRREGGLNRNQMVFLIVRVGPPENDAPPLEPGVFVQAELTGEPRDRVALLPRSSMAGHDSVWVLDDDKRLRRRGVEVLYRDQDHLYVTEGLESPAEVVKAGGMRLLEGTRVEPLGAMASPGGRPVQAESRDVAQH
jgi:RND family efflux transporter MFP subunit